MSMEQSYQMDIVTPDKTAFSRSVTSIILPTVEGYLGVLANHAPLMAELAAGKIQIKEPDGKKAIVVISGGFVDVKSNKMTILAESIDYIEEKMVNDFGGLNLAKADTALKDARNRMASFKA